MRRKPSDHSLPSHFASDADLASKGHVKTRNRSSLVLGLLAVLTCLVVAALWRGRAAAPPVAPVARPAALSETVSAALSETVPAALSESAREVPRASAETPSRAAAAVEETATASEPRRGPPAAAWTQPASVPIGMVEEHHHVLPYYVRAARAGHLPQWSGATIVHVDSHADMGLPHAYPVDTLPFDKPSDLERYTAINDFLIMAVFLGMAEHLVFVEPPWSNQWRCCVYDVNATFTFAIGVDAKEQLRVDAVGETAKLFARERFGHVFWRENEKRVADVKTLTRVKYFRVSVIASESSTLPKLIKEYVDPTRPWILDVDLDFFATESPGAMLTMRDFGLHYEHLETLYHLAWNFPQLGAAYQSAGEVTRDAGDATYYARKVREDLNGFVDSAVKKKSGFSGILERALSRRILEPWRLRAITDYAASLSIRPTHGSLVQAELRANLEAFIEQPFHVPNTVALEAELDFTLDKVWKPLLKDLPRPVLVNLVRSPTYLPEHMLNTVECRVLSLLSNLYKVTTLHHEPRVNALRARCATKYTAQVIPAE